MTESKATSPRDTLDAVRELSEGDPVSEHEWYRTFFTGNIVCAKCRLLPLDDEDYESECEASR